MIRTFRIKPEYYDFSQITGSAKSDPILVGYIISMEMESCGERVNIALVREMDMYNPLIGFMMEYIGLNGLARVVEVVREYKKTGTSEFAFED